MIKKIYIIILIIGIMVTACDTRKDIIIQDRTICSENFPDGNFREYIAENFDTDKDGILSVKEAESITEIDVYHKEIEELKGIEYFVNLQNLDANLKN